MPHCGNGLNNTAAVRAGAMQRLGQNTFFHQQYGRGEGQIQLSPYHSTLGRSGLGSIELDICMCISTVRQRAERIDPITSHHLSLDDGAIELPVLDKQRSVSRIYYTAKDIRACPLSAVTAVRLQPSSSTTIWTRQPCRPPASKDV